jgi:hypothetical protein
MDQFVAGMIPWTYGAPQLKNFTLAANIYFQPNFKEQFEFVSEC